MEQSNLTSGYCLQTISSFICQERFTAANYTENRLRTGFYGYTCIALYVCKLLF